MTLLESVIADWSNDQLRTAATSGLPILAAAAQAELDSRPSAHVKPVQDTEAWIRATFPQRPPLGDTEPRQAAKTHGTGCPPGCCGAGVRQWRD